MKFPSLKVLLCPFPVSPLLSEAIKVMFGFVFSPQIIFVCSESLCKCSYMVHFLVCLALLLSIFSLRPIHIILYVSMLFLCTAQYSFLYKNVKQFIYPFSSQWTLEFSLVWGIMNNVSINIPVQE